MPTHIRKAYTKLDGTRVKSHIVKTKLKLKKGNLSKFGYAVRVPANKRHLALKKAEMKDGFAKIIQRLNAIKTLTKNTQPKNSSLYNNDLHWLQKHK